jgi:hypothetical protein
MNNRFSWIVPGRQILCQNELIIDDIVVCKGDVCKILNVEGHSYPDNVIFSTKDNSIKMFLGDFIYYFRDHTTKEDIKRAIQPVLNTKGIGQVISHEHPSTNKDAGKYKFIGFWAQSQAEMLLQLGVKIIFPWPADLVDETWTNDLNGKREKHKILYYMKMQPKVEHWLGYSWCRICDKHNNGASDQSDGVYYWPEGYIHYIEEHNVKPPQEFIDHVIQKLGPDDHDEHSGMPLDLE